VHFEGFPRHGKQLVPHAEEAATAEKQKQYDYYQDGFRTPIIASSLGWKGKPVVPLTSPAFI
jgi:hypothetical protein